MEHRYLNLTGLIAAVLLFPFASPVFLADELPEPPSIRQAPTTQAKEQQTPPVESGCSLWKWLGENQHIAVWLAAVGTIGAVVVSLCLSWKGSREFRKLLKIQSLPIQIELARNAAQRIWDDREGPYYKIRDGRLCSIPTDRHSLCHLLRFTRNLRRMYGNTGSSSNNDLSSKLERAFAIRYLDDFERQLETLIWCFQELENAIGRCASELPSELLKTLSELWGEKNQDTEKKATCSGSPDSTRK